MGKQSRRESRRNRPPRAARAVRPMPPMLDDFGLVTAEYHDFIRDDCPECAGRHGCSFCAEGVEHCDGVEVEHRDGERTCTAIVCVGLDVLHVNGASCGLFGPCDRCGRR